MISPTLKFLLFFILSCYTERKKEVFVMPYVNIKITREGNVTPEKKQALIEGE